MAQSLNKAMLIGRLGKDPELRYTQQGSAMCRFSLATGETWKDKQTGEKKEKTTWHNIVVWGKVAEIVNEYLAKGRQVYLEGRIENRSWEDNEGVKKYITEINADKVIFLGSRGDSPAAVPDDSFSTDDIVDDDIPF